MKSFANLLSISLCLISMSAFGAPIVFDFSGLFGKCDGDCGDVSLESLAGEGYSGSLSIPAISPTLEPDRQNRPSSDDMIWSYYELSGRDASLSFDTIGTAFDISQATPINTIVSYCVEFSCPSNRNFVWFSFIGPQYTHTLNFNSVPDFADRSTAIPTADDYGKFVSIDFGIYRNEDFQGIYTNQLSPFEAEINLSVSQVPLPAGVFYVLSCLPLTLGVALSSSIVKRSP